jgi:hypothetical protein
VSADCDSAIKAAAAITTIAIACANIATNLVISAGELLLPRLGHEAVLQIVALNGGCLRASDCAGGSCMRCERCACVGQPSRAT